MQHKKVFFTLAAFVLLIPALASTIGGVHSFEIYLNNKLLTRQYVSEPLSLKTLPLNASNANDQLVVYYNHCGLTGTSRKIAIKDGAGKIVKEWKFANASGSKKGMSIPVKEVLQLQQQYAKSQLSMVYTSQELPEGRLLTGVQFSGKSDT